MSRARPLTTRITVLFLAVVFLLLAPEQRVRAELAIEGIEINQAIGIQKDNHRNFVAGKNTVVRAILSEAVDIDKQAKLLGAEDAHAVVKRDGVVVATLSPKAYDSPTKIVDFLCPSLNACGNWAAGSYVFETTVKGVTATTAGTAYEFKERRSLRLLAVPMKANYHGKITQVPKEIKWQTWWQYMRNVYPVADKGIVWTPGPELDASSSEYDLEKSSDAGCKALWRALANLIPAECAANPQAEGCYDQVVGFISDKPGASPDDPESGLQGFTEGPQAIVVAAKDEDAQATVAHENGHAQGDLGDTYPGGDFNCPVNPAPDGYKGGDYNNPGKKNFSCKEGKKALPGTHATRIPEDVHPYEVNGRGPLGDMACFMGSKSVQKQIWITPEAYDRLFDQLAPKPQPEQLQRTAVGRRLIRFSGSIRKGNNKVLLEPWESFRSATDVPDTAGGDFTLKALDQAGNMLASQMVDARFHIQTNPPKNINPGPFDGVMRFPEGTTEFDLVRNRDGKTLATVQVNPDPPTVAGVEPTSSREIAGEYDVRWTATSPDGSALYARVEYNPDVASATSRWQTLAADLEDSHLLEDFAQLPGGLHAKVRVTVTDGVNASSAESAEFTVPFKAPEVYVDDPAWGDLYQAGDEILLEGDAYDQADGWLPDANLSWSSNLSGPIGQGSRLITSALPPGEHTITLTATNTLGLSSAGSVTLRIDPCTFVLAPQNHRFPWSKTSFQVTVVATGAETCSLTDDDLQTQTDDGGKWLKAKVVNFENGQGTVKITVLANGRQFVRTGSVLVLGHAFEVTQIRRPASP